MLVHKRKVRLLAINIARMGDGGLKFEQKVRRGSMNWKGVQVGRCVIGRRRCDTLRVMLSTSGDKVGRRMVYKVGRVGHGVSAVTCDMNLIA